MDQRGVELPVGATSGRSPVEKEANVKGVKGVKGVKRVKNDKSVKNVKGVNGYGVKSGAGRCYRQKIIFSG